MREFMSMQIAPEQNDVELPSGSQWHRWDPHIHAPGTTLNDQFRGQDAIDRYVEALNTAEPPIRALGITDYYLLDTYEMVHELYKEGRLKACKFVFPNVELRLGLQTNKGKFINLHLLICPDDADHVEQARRFLGQLTFDAFGSTFRCIREDLTRLGREADRSKTNDIAALKHGANQFKVNFTNLKDTYRKNDWARNNIIIAISGNETDGSAGMRDASDATLRQEMEKFAHVILASSPAQRAFWLGQKAVTVDELKERYSGLKPCLHGSDAHALDKVGIPDNERRSWIKGALNFESLRQACIDPEGRAYVGPSYPSAGLGSQLITRVDFTNTPWLQTPVINLNPGLITIIGARGSGKTALADMIAAGCDALRNPLNPASFLARAQNRNQQRSSRINHLQGAAIRVNWNDGEVEDRSIDGSYVSSSTDYARARYLSQQFVENLCSADGMTDALISEIERVIFESHSLVDQNGAVDFNDMREDATARHRLSRERAEQSLHEISDAISIEIDKQRQVETLSAQSRKTSAIIKTLENDRSSLVIAGGEDRLKRLANLSDAADKVRGYIRAWTARKNSVVALKDEIKEFRAIRAPSLLNQAKINHKGAGLADDKWSNFLLVHKGDVDKALSVHESEADTNSNIWRGKPIASTDNKDPLIADDADLEKQSLSLLEAEIIRLQSLIDTDKTTAARYVAVSTKIDQSKVAFTTINDKLADAMLAADRLVQLRAARIETYKNIFRSITEEQSALTLLYAPLMQQIAEETGTVTKLSFVVHRQVNIDGWAEEGEKLFDLRSGDFKGKGSLRDYAEASLQLAWEAGDENEVAAAMAAFLDKHQATLLRLANVPRTEQVNFREWARKFAEWLYGTSHISLQYSINYDGIDVRHLSPGTRGIVLLLMYLMLDTHDTRPLIIDQPEENLDPQSIFEELVPLFIKAKTRRQVILVTHNANLVINTDADQIIIANAHHKEPGRLPLVRYQAGGLEEKAIRDAVCLILEGGEPAFRERARRLRVRLER